MSHRIFKIGSVNSFSSFHEMEADYPPDGQRRNSKVHGPRGNSELYLELLSG